MKRRGRFWSIEGSKRVRCNRLGAPLLESTAEYTPLLRNDLTFDMRRSELAEGDSKMIGSRRRDEGFLRFETRAGELVAFRWFALEGGGWPGRFLA